jgi:predicted nucleic acid-binding protein
VDTSVLIQGSIEDNDSARVETLLNMLNDPEPIVLHLPEFCLVECTNVLWKRVRFVGTTAEEAQNAIRDLLALPLTVHTISELLPRALVIGLNHELSVYDAVHIALAEKLGHSLITVDPKQAKAAVAIGVTLKPITDFAEFKNNQ